MDVINIGRKIKDARLAKNMTQEELGKLLGVQKSAIAKYESGRVVNIKRSTLKKISDILDLHPSELIFDEEQREIEKINDTLTDIVIRMRTDKDFLSVVETLYNFDSEKFNAVKSLFVK